MRSDPVPDPHSATAERRSELDADRQSTAREPARFPRAGAGRPPCDTCKRSAAAAGGDRSGGMSALITPANAIFTNAIPTIASPVTHASSHMPGSPAQPARPAPASQIRPESHLSDDALCARVARIIYHEAGIVLGAGNSNMILARLGKRIARAGCTDLAGYVRLLEGPDGAALIPDLVTALTTNVTQFFREPHHFDFLRGVVAPGWCHDIDTPLSIWSAGCSSGQEPYSIAMALSPPALSWADSPPVTILATDIDRDVLEQAERGEYSQAQAASIPPALREAWFQPGPAGVRARPGLRGKVEFRPLNLHGRWALSGQFDVIFCRNVIIYFDAAAQLLLWEKFLYHLRPGGWLIVGHSEHAPKALQARVRQVGPTVYQSADPVPARG